MNYLIKRYIMTLFEILSLLAINKKKRLIYK